ncbi:MAG: DNRLRE domain-containing protein [Planctomycetes bacterium]|nr:DNRLRE domain-containing protein [Planctomycetota bacterium]
MSPRIPLLLSLALLLCQRARADVVTLTSSKDATIYNDTVGNRTDSKGPTMYSGQAGTSTAWPMRRALVAFDTSSIPVGSTVTAVQLKLYMSKTVVGAKSFSIHKLSRAWNEGPTSGYSGNGNTAQVGDPTWLHTYFNNQFWTTPGGDFSPTASATVTIGSTYMFYTWGSTTQMVSDVQSWVANPSQNFGWIVRGPEGGLKSAKQFETRESLPAYWPQLVVTYTLPGPTPYCTAKVNSLGCTPAIGSSGSPDFNAGSGFAITLTNTLNQKSGLLFYGTLGPAASPFQGGTMCVQPPVLRTVAQTSGGSAMPANNCSGSFSYDFNVLIASGVNPLLTAGRLVCAQYWSRDPAATFTTNLSNALRFYIYP